MQPAPLFSWMAPYLPWCLCACEGARLSSAEPMPRCPASLGLHLSYSRQPASLHVHLPAPRLPNAGRALSTKVPEMFPGPPRCAVGDARQPHTACRRRGHKPAGKPRSRKTWGGLHGPAALQYRCTHHPHAAPMQASQRPDAGAQRTAAKAAKRAVKEARRLARQGQGDPSKGQKPCTLCQSPKDMLIRWVGGWRRGGRARPHAAFTALNLGLLGPRWYVGGPASPIARRLEGPAHAAPCPHNRKGAEPTENDLVPGACVRRLLREVGVA